MQMPYFYKQKIFRKYIQINFRIDKVSKVINVQGLYTKVFHDNRKANGRQKKQIAKHK